MMEIAVYILTFAVFGTTTTYADRPQSQSVKFRFKETNNLKAKTNTSIEISRKSVKVNGTAIEGSLVPRASKSIELIKQYSATAKSTAEPCDAGTASLFWVGNASPMEKRLCLGSNHVWQIQTQLRKLVLLAKASDRLRKNAAKTAK